MFISRYLDLPAVPEKFVQQCWDVLSQKGKQNDNILNPHVLGYSHGRALYRNGQLHGHSSGFGLQHVSDEFDRWIKDNIVPTFKYAGIGSTVPGMNHCGPHRDQSRDFSLLYLLKSGGNESSTQFFEEKQPQEPQNYYDNYDDFNQIGEIKPSLHQWYMLNAKVVHSVENITDGRVSIQISLLADQVPQEWVS